MGRISKLEQVEPLVFDQYMQNDGMETTTPSSQSRQNSSIDVQKYAHAIVSIKIVPTNLIIACSQGG